MKKNSKRMLSVLLAAIMVLSVVSPALPFAGSLLDGLFTQRASANNTASLTVTANTSGTLFDSKGNYINLWSKGVVGNASEAPLDFVEYIEIMNATGGGDGQQHPTVSSNGASTADSTDRDLIDASGNFITAKLTALTNSIDSIIAVGAKPLIKLGGVPFYFTMTTNPNKWIESGMSCNPYPPDTNITYTTKYYSAGTTKTGYEGYEYYLMDVIQYLINKYTLAEVKTWRWGVMTEFENKDWFYTYSDRNKSNVSTSGTDSADAFCMVYDYSAEAVITLLGESDTYIGAHAMAVSEGIWNENLFIDHIADGFNFAKGDTKLGVNGAAVSTTSANRHGVHCDYIAVSYYEPSLGSAQYNTKTLTQTVDYIRDYAKRQANSLTSGVVNNREQASAATLNNLKYGVDEGRILSGPAGANSTALNSRTVGYTIQGAYDARMYYQMVEDDIDYFSSWSFTSNGAGTGYPAITYHVAERTAEMAGANRYKATVTGGSGITTKPGKSNVEYNAYGSYDTGTGTMRVMAYNFCNNYSYTTPTDLTLSVDLPASFAGKNVKIKKYAINDEANFFDEWKTDCAANGLTTSAFSWSSDDPEIESGNTCLSAGLALASQRRNYYKSCAQLIPTAQIVTADANGDITLTYNGMQANSAVYYEIEETSLSDETHTVLFDVNDSSGANVNLLPLSIGGETSFNESGVDVDYDPVTGVLTLNGTAVRNTTDSQDDVVLLDVLVSKANGTKLKSGDAVSFSSEGVGGSVSGGALVAELYTSDGQSVATKAGLTGQTHANSRCYIDLYDINNHNTTNTIPGSGVTAEYVRLYVYIPDGASQATFANFKVKLKLESGSTATKYTPNAKIINTGDVYGDMPAVERTNYKLNTWKLINAAVDATSTFNGAQNTTLTAEWTSNPGCDVYFNVNHDSVGVNLFKPSLDSKTYTSPYTGHSGSIAYSYNQNTGVITLNGSIKGIQYGDLTDDNNFYLLSVPITTTAGTQYAATIDFLSGSITAAGTTLNPAVVVDLSDRDNLYGTTRSYLNATGVGTFKSTSTGSGTWKALTASSYLVFWVWCDGTQFNLNNVKLKVKVAQESTATAFSPNARQCSQGQGYGIVQEPEYREGYKFDGWYTAQTGGTRITATSTCPNSSSTTLWAHWTAKPTYTVTFNQQGGTGGEATKVVTAEVNPPQLTSIPTKAGYKFGGYFTAENGQGTCYYGEDGTGAAPYTEGENKTLYANWVSSSTISSSDGASGGTAFFNVPEAIYMTPGATSFQYVVDQTISSTAGAMTLNTAVGGKTIGTGGNVEFYLSDSSVTSVDIAWYLSGSATVGGSASSSGKVTISSRTNNANSISVFKTTITAGSMTENKDNQMITWVASYVKGGKAYSFINYTFVYMPNTQISGAAGWAINDGLSSIKLGRIQSVLYIQGLESVSGVPSGSTSGMKSFDTSGTYIPNNNLQPMTTGVTATDGTTDITNWLTNTSTNPTINFGKYSLRTDQWVGVFVPGYTANLVTDSSRYTNLNQVPNLKYGLFTSNTYGLNADRKFYVSIYNKNGTDPYLRGAYTSDGNKKQKADPECSEYSYTDKSSNSNLKLAGTTYSSAGMMSNGTINYAISQEGVYTFAVKGFVQGHNSNANYAYVYNCLYAPISITAVTKSALRSDIQAVYTKMGCFSDLTTNCQKNLVAKLQEACLCLGNPKATAADISAAKTALEAIYYEKRTGTATFNDYKMVGNTTKTLVNTETINYTFGQTVSSVAGIYEGYNLTSTTTTANLFNAQEFLNITLASEGSNTSSIVSYGNNGISVQSGNDTDNYTTMPWNNAYGCELTRNLYRVAVEPGATYRLYADISGTDTKQMMVFALKAYGDITSGQWAGITGTDGGSSYVQYTIPSDCYYVSFRFGNKEANAATYFNNIRFVKTGNSATTISNANADSMSIDRVYSPYTYTVAYYLNGGSGTAPTSQTKYHDTPITLHYIADANLPTKAGYTFEGWNTAANGSGVDYANGATFAANGTTNAQTITLYAKWVNYTVTINPNGGSYNSTSSNTVTNVTAGNTYAFAEPTRAGYLFAGWTIENQPTDAVILGNGYTQSYYSVDSGVVIDNVTKSDSSGVYTNYKAYGTNNTIGDKYVQINLALNYAIQAGDTVTVTMDYRKNSGATGLNLYNGAARNDYAAGSVALAATDWTTVSTTRTFSAASTTGHMQISSSAIAAGATKTAASPFFDIDVKNVKVKVTHNSTDTYVQSKLTMPKGNVVLTANWIKNTNYVYYNNEFKFDEMYPTAASVNIDLKNNTFVTNAGSGETDVYSRTFTVVPGHSYLLSFTATNVGTVSTQHGFIVYSGDEPNQLLTSGWGGGSNPSYDEGNVKNYSKPFTVGADSGVTSAKIRFDVYTANAKVKFSNICIVDTTANGTPNGTAYALVDEGNDIGACPATFTNSGYSLAGWYTGKNGTGTQYTSTSDMGATDLYLYSKWNANSYRVGYDNLYFPADNGYTGFDTFEDYDSHSIDNTNKTVTITHKSRPYQSNGKTVYDKECTPTSTVYINVNPNTEYIVSGTFAVSGASETRAQLYCFYYKNNSGTACSIAHTDASTKTISNVDGVAKTSAVGTPQWESGSHYYVIKTPSDCNYMKLRIDCDNTNTTQSGTVVASNIRVIQNTAARRGATYSAPEYTATYDQNYNLITPTTVGYTFEGWYKEPALTTKVTASTKVATASNHTLYSKWTGNNYTLKVYNDTVANGGACILTVPSTASTCITSGETYYAALSWHPVNTMTKPGYIFAGLYDADGVMVYGTDFTAVTCKYWNGGYCGAQDLTVYAHWTKIANDDTYVLDSGNAVTLDVLKNDLSGAAIKSVGTVTGGTATIESGKIKFVPSGILSSVITFTYTATLGGVDSTATVKLIPATSVYYEESFVQFVNDTTSATQIIWQSAGSTATAALDARRSGEAGSGAYGDMANAGGTSVYNSTNSATYSMGSAQMVEITSANTNKKNNMYAEFTFTGTGFEVYTLMSVETGYVSVDIYNSETGARVGSPYFVLLDNGYAYGQLYMNNGELSHKSEGGQALYTSGKGKEYHLHGVTYYTEPTSAATAANELAYGWLAVDSEHISSITNLYQTPAIIKTGLEWGSYRVRLTPKFSSKYDVNKNSKAQFYFDSVRIFDPLNPASLDAAAAAAYKADDEYDAKYKCIRDILVDSTTLPEITGTGKTAGVAFLGTLGAEKDTFAATLQQYKDVGPNHEVYLNPGQTIGCYISTGSSTPPEKLTLGIKLVNGTGTGTITIDNVYNNDGVSKTKTSTVSTTVSTEQYRNITNDIVWDVVNGEYIATVFLTNTGNQPVSLTNFRYSYNNAATTISTASVKKAAAERELSFFFDSSLLTQYGIAAQSKDDVTIAYQTKSMAWDADEIELGNTVTLSVECPEEIAKITVDGEEITMFAEVEGGRVFTYNFTPEELGSYQFSIVLYDGNGYHSTDKVTPICRVVEPKIDLNEVAMVWDADAVKLGDGATLTIDAPANITKVTVGDETLTEFTENGDKRVFTYSVTPAAIGKYAYTVVFEEAHGFKSTNVLTPTLTVASYVVPTENVEISWDKDAYEVGDDAVLTVKTPANITKVTADGAEITNVEETESGKIFTLTVNTEAEGKLEYAIRLTDENDMISKTVSSGIASITEPEVPDEPTDEPTEPEPEKLTFWQKLVRIFATFFKSLVNLFKEVF